MAPLHLPLPVSLSSLLKLLLPFAALVLCIITFLDISVSLEIYRKSWIAREVQHIEPLTGCFNPQNLSPAYNLTLARGPKYYEVHAGTPMRLGLDCYDFAGTVGPEVRNWIEGRTYYHMYWRADLLPFAERQVWTLRSFFATQDISRSTLILWSNGDLSQNRDIATFLHTYPDAFQVRMIDIEELARGTALDGSPMLARAGKDRRAWVDGDLVRLLVVWYYGGVWVDMDSLLTRDLAPLLEHEFVVQWDCYDKKFMPLNGAILHFQQHSPYLCEAFHIMATGPPPQPNSIDWGSRLYHKLWRRLLAAGIEPFKILPWCFIDGSNCGYENSLPDPLAKDGKFWGEGRTYEEGGELDKILTRKVFSVHVHNRWDKEYPKGGWVERLLLRGYQARLGEL
ncbi:hypothetical protein DACRYDRAFT_88808 [Dacryopinax primogenitus]|uniref:Glycosyltransferase family 32 protein n=1 Tax=Dacryopinax primogenitus (strain DJM 731) TaxID=1858805 RepID=M5G144_DACPD|nr:uncharacterized protein DACRYDRAFT_88808 [Dacryopinax primogenitus]EJU02459.1 hypothetical protein DACRYDRAFT_88808 [Dacryopinax primogenitus]